MAKKRNQVELFQKARHKRNSDEFAAITFYDAVSETFRVGPADQSRPAASQGRVRMVIQPRLVAPAIRSRRQCSGIGTIAAESSAGRLPNRAEE